MFASSLSFKIQLSKSYYFPTDRQLCEIKIPLQKMDIHWPGEDSFSSSEEMDSPSAWIRRGTGPSFQGQGSQPCLMISQKDSWKPSWCRGILLSWACKGWLQMKPKIWIAFLNIVLFMRMIFLLVWNFRGHVYICGGFVDALNLPWRTRHICLSGRRGRPSSGSCSCRCFWSRGSPSCWGWMDSLPCWSEQGSPFLRACLLSCQKRDIRHHPINS